MRRLYDTTDRLPLAVTIKRIRESHGWSKDKMAAEIGVCGSHYRQFEAGHYEVPLRIIERIREVTGIDPYVLAYCLHHNANKLPPEIQKLQKAFGAGWDLQLTEMAKIHQRLPSWISQK